MQVLLEFWRRWEKSVSGRRQGRCKEPKEGKNSGISTHPTDRREADEGGVGWDWRVNEAGELSRDQIIQGVLDLWFGVWVFSSIQQNGGEDLSWGVRRSDLYFQLTFAAVWKLGWRGRSGVEWPVRSWWWLCRTVLNVFTGGTEKWADPQGVVDAEWMEGVKGKGGIRMICQRATSCQIWQPYKTFGTFEHSQFCVFSGSAHFLCLILAAFFPFFFFFFLLPSFSICESPSWFPSFSALDLLYLFLLKNRYLFHFNHLSADNWQLNSLALTYICSGIQNFC